MRWLNKGVIIDGEKGKVVSIDKSFYYRLENEQGEEYPDSVSDYGLYRNEVENEKRGIINN